MSLTIGAAGLPSAGKSTLFNALTRTTALATNYPFVTIEPNVGVMPPSDARLDKLVELFHSAKVVPATVSFVGIAGIVRGASQGEDLSNRFLANIHGADTICLVMCASVDPDAVRVEGRVDLKDDIETVTTELVLADMQTPKKQTPRLTKGVTGKETLKEMLRTAEAALELLEQGKVLPAHGTDLDPTILCGFGSMITKKLICAFNTDDAGPADEAMQAKLRDFVVPAEAVFLDAKFEAGLVELEPEEARETLKISGQDEAGFDRLARVGFDTLGLRTYLAAGEKEARAWAIHKGWAAPQVAGVIHTGFERGFIKAKIVNCDDLIEYGSLAKARAHGRVRMEGKDYAMTDGDVVEFRTGLTSKK